MKGVDLSNYALEDLLAFDDIFLDYFNNFLKNLAFPQQIQYNRYLGIFEEIEHTLNSIVLTDRLPKHISFSSLNQNSSLNHQNDSTPSERSDTEHNKIFDWVRHERLPLFFRTDFFREFKLCKLLTRSLDGDRPNSATSSQLIGGYSRQSPPISNSLSTEDPEGRTTAGAAILFASASNNNINETSLDKMTNNEFEEMINGFYNVNDLDLESSFQIDMPYLERFNRALFQRPGSRALSVPSYFPFASMNQYNSSNLLKSSKKRTATSKSNKSSYKSGNNEMDMKSNLKRLENFDDLTQINSNEQKQDEKKTPGKSQNNKNQNSETKKKNDTNSKQIQKLTTNTTTTTTTTTKNTIPSNPHNSNNNDVLNASFYDEDDESEQEYYEEDYEEATENVKNNNFSLKLDDNLSFVEDEVENDDYIDTSNIHASINQYKLKFLGSVNGMNEFKDFLKNTSGFRLYKFWLDCEFYRDSMQDYDQIDNMATRNRLFRDIVEKYVFPFAKKMHEKVTKNYFMSQGLNHSLFDRIQYDILRRLRSYWVPRFVLSKLKQKGKDYGSFPLPPLTPDYSRQSTYISAPSSSKILPFSAKQNRPEVFDDDQKKLLYNKVKQALLVDKDAGGPFLRYISSNCPENLPLILFWYDVCDFNNVDSIGYDKNSRLQHAWAIYNSYLSSTARFNIGISNEISEEARRSLQMQSNPIVNNGNDIDTNLFQPVMEQIVPYLENAWIQFIKDDVLKFTEARLSLLTKTDEDDDDETKIFDKIPEPELFVENSQIYLKRPWIIEMLLNGGKPKAETAKKRVLTEEEKRERMIRLKQIENERKKALKAAAQRAKMNKLSAVEEEKNEEMRATETQEKVEKKPPKKVPTFATDRSAFFEKMLSNKSMMQIFRKYFFDRGQKDMMYKFNTLVDAKQYLELDDQSKKNNISIAMMKNYLDPNSKKSILPLNEKLLQKLNAESSADQRGAPRPKTPFMIATIKEFRPILEEHFQKFCELQATEHSLATPEDFAILNQTELLTLLGDSYNPKDFDFDEEKGEGKVTASKEDRAEFLKILYEWSIGRSSDKLYMFFAYLTEHGKKDDLPFLDKDLLFCIDTIRLKEINGEEVVKQKSQVIIDVFLDSPVPPTTQLDINHETQQKLLKAATKITQGVITSVELNLFDEQRGQLVKELVPYWAGFKHNNKEGNQLYVTKQDKLLKERLDEFMNMKNPSPNDFKLPPLSPHPYNLTPTNLNPNKSFPSAITSNAPALNIVFSIATGIKFKDDRALNTGRNSVTASNDRRNSNTVPLHIK